MPTLSNMINNIFKKKMNMITPDNITEHGKNLSGVDLSGENLNGVDLSGVDLNGAHLNNVNLRGANLSGANLNYTDLSDSDLRYINLHDAVLRYADLLDADLRHANLRDADLSGADINYTDLRNADLNGANITNTCLDPTNVPNGITHRFETLGKWTIGYRTKNSKYTNPDFEYQIGEIYEAPIFSTSDKRCHPGLYVRPHKEKGDITVLFMPCDCHMADDKFRVKRFLVWKEGK